MTSRLAKRPRGFDVHSRLGIGGAIIAVLMRTRLAGLLLGLATVLAATSWAASKPATERVSVSSSGGQASGLSLEPALSGNGRFVAFQSLASDLVPGDTNGMVDFFVFDRRSRRLERVSVSSSGTEATGGTLAVEPPWLSGSGRIVAFASDAPGLVAGDTNGVWDVFIRDRSRGRTIRASVRSSGAQANGRSQNLRVSENGRFVVFESEASNLVRGDTNRASDVFAHDLRGGETTRVSVSSRDRQGNGPSSDPAISADGRFVSFSSEASNLVPGDTNRASDVFVHDRRTHRTIRASLNSLERQGNSDSMASHLAPAGMLVAFTSRASNLARGDSNRASDIFVRDTAAGRTERISVSSTGGQANADSNYAAGFAGRRYIAFRSSASNLARGDTNKVQDVFVHDRMTRVTRRVSVGPAGTQANAGSSSARLSADGRFVAFASFASNLVRGDTNATSDIFVRGPLGRTGVR
jgi:Tol biopolymer transport system component